MSPIVILYPLFALVLLTFLIMFYMGHHRFGAMRRREVKPKDYAVRKWDEQPYDCAMAGNHYHNLFEMPTLFYALIPLIMITKQVDIVLVVLAWVYVVLRYIHAYIHTQIKNVQWRFMCFLTSSVVLLVMWAIFAGRIVLSGL